MNLALTVSVEQRADRERVAGGRLDARRQDHAHRRVGLFVALLEVAPHVEEVEHGAGGRRIDLDDPLVVPVPAVAALDEPSREHRE